MFSLHPENYISGFRNIAQTGLDFVSGSSNAAPLDITKIAKDLQFTVVTSHNDTQVHITPVFHASFVSV